jgi:hypothetical protein
MKNNQHIQEEVEKTLRVLDTMVNLESNPFLFTRVESGMVTADGKETASITVWSALIQATIVIILFFNIVTAIFYFEFRSTVDINDSLTTALRNDYQIVLYQDQYFIGK